MWGLQADGTFPSAHDNHTMPAKMLVALGVKRVVDIYSIVMSDVQKVRKALSSELQAFQQSSLQGDAEKGRRLLFLFQRDLLPGVNAMILESKGKRDALGSEGQVEAWQTANGKAGASSCARGGDKGDSTG